MENLLSNDLVYDVWFNKINQNFQELNTKKIELTGEKIEENLNDYALIMDSEDSFKIKKIKLSNTGISSIFMNAKIWETWFNHRGGSNYATIDDNDNIYVEQINVTISNSKIRPVSAFINKFDKNLNLLKTIDISSFYETGANRIIFLNWYLYIMWNQKFYILDTDLNFQKYYTVGSMSFWLKNYIIKDYLDYFLILFTDYLPTNLNWTLFYIKINKITNSLEYIKYIRTTDDSWLNIKNANIICDDINDTLYYTYNNWTDTKIATINFFWDVLTTSELKTIPYITWLAYVYNWIIYLFSSSIIYIYNINTGIHYKYTYIDADFWVFSKVFYNNNNIYLINNYWDIYYEFNINTKYIKKITRTRAWIDTSYNPGIPSVICKNNYMLMTNTYRSSIYTRVLPYVFKTDLNFNVWIYNSTPNMYTLNIVEYNNHYSSIISWYNTWIMNITWWNFTFTQGSLPSISYPAWTPLTIYDFTY